MTTTPIFGLTELASGQAVPETNVNERFRALENGARWFGRVKDRDLATPPGSPADGDCYLVAASPTGAWTGHAGDIAFRMSTAWEFIEVLEGDGAYFADENVAAVFDGAAWTAFSTGSSYTDEMARDAIGAALVAGSNITITPNDGGDTITIAATGGGGGGGSSSWFLPGSMMLAAVPGSTTINAIGAGSSASGTTSVSPAGTSYQTRFPCIGVQHGAAANQMGFLRFSAAQLFGINGFTAGTATINRQVLASGRLLFGCYATWTTSNDPSTATDLFCVGKDGADTNLQVMHRNGSSSVTKIDLGASFPATTLGAAYQIELTIDEGGTTASYNVTRLDTGATATGTISSNLPDNDTALNLTHAVGSSSVAAVQEWGMNVLWARLNLA